MRIPNSWFILSIAASLAVLSAGCSSEPSVENSEPIEMDGPPPDLGGTMIGDAHGHDDVHQGPHGGRVIELGRSHEFHAEIVEDDDARIVTVHILGREMQPWPIEQSEVVLSLRVDGTPRSFTFPAKDSAEGKASRFEAPDRESFAALHEPGATGKLLVTINGKSYSGVVEPHDHNHDH